MKNRMHGYFLARLISSERGQILPLMGLMAIVLLGFVGFAIDLGLIAKKKAEVVRAVDAASLAAALKLPDEVAAQNEVVLYLGDIQPDATVLEVSFPEDRQVLVRASAPQDLTFIKVLNLMPGIDIANPAVVTAEAVAGFGVQPLDVVLNMDSTGSMGFAPCNSGSDSTTPGCPIKESRDAANLFTDILLGDNIGSSATQIGLAPYNYCYRPPRMFPNCVNAALITNLTNNKGLLQGRINGLRADGNTNVCLGLLKAGEVLFESPNSQEGDTVSRIIIIISDGDNWWSGNGFGDGEPPVECRPINPGSADGPGFCSTTTPQEGDLDQKTYNVAEGLKDQGAEIFVVGFGVCMNPSDDLCNTGIIGDPINDDPADRNLLKCIASSTDGTNDHYFEVESASDLPDVFETIARLLSFRLIK